MNRLATRLQLICTFTLGLLLFSLQGFAQSATCDSLLQRSLLQEGVSQRDEGRVAVFPDGVSKFADLLHVVDSARHHIHVEYFIFADDSIAHTFLDHLRRKAAEGVEVRLVVDDYKSVVRHYGYTPNRLRELRSAGVDIRMFSPFRFPYVNHIARDHRKIVVVDGRVGYIGGLNVSDYYLHGDPATYGPWRDTHVRITGPAVETLQRYFCQSFVASGGETFDGADYYPYTLASASSALSTSKLFDASSVDLSYFHLPDDDLPTEGITFVERSRTQKSQMRHAFVAAFRSAQKRLLIVSPYFLPTSSVRRALLDALDRGVDVQVLLSYDSDEPLLVEANINFARRLMRHGAKVYLYRGGFHHSKILMVDDSYSMVGSANLNSRSLRWDYEASCFLFSPEVTARLTEIFQQDLRSSDLLTDSLYKTFPCASRLKGALVNHLLTPIL
jgi:cardiolipin synthase